MGTVRLGRLLSFLIISVACIGASLQVDANDRSQQNSSPLTASDWPCKTDYRSDLAETLSWPRPTLLKQSADWRDNADIKMLVESAVTSSRTELGVSALESFAQELSGNDLERDRTLTTVFLGIRDEMTLYREFVAFGIMQGVANAELATGLAKDAKAKGEKGRIAFKAALRIEDDAMDDARFLCQRLDALENKYQELSGALIRYLTRSSS